MALTFVYQPTSGPLSGSSFEAQTIAFFESLQNNLQGQITAISASINQITLDIKSLRDLISANTASINALQDRCEVIESDIAQNTQDISKLRSDLSDLTSTVSGNSSRIGQLEVRMDAVEEKNDGQAADLSQLNTRMQIAEDSIKYLRDLTSEHTSQISSLSSRISNLPDGVTITMDEDGHLHCQDVAIAGVLEDLASASGLIGQAKGMAEVSTSYDEEGYEEEVTTYTNIDTDVFDLLLAEPGIEGTGTMPPETDSSWYVRQYFSERSGTGARKQIAWGTTTNRSYVRMYSGSGWTDWIEVPYIEQIEAITDENTQQNERLNAVEQLNTEQDNRLSSIEKLNTTQDERLDAVEAKNTEQDGRLDSIEAENEEQNSRLDSIDTKDTEQDSRLTQIETKNTEQDERLEALETTTSEHTTDISDLTTRVTALESSSSDQGSDISSIQSALEELTTTVEGNTSSISDLTTTTTEQGTSITNLQNSLESLETTVSGQATSISSLTSEIEALQTQISKLDPLPDGLIALVDSDTAPDGFALCDGSNGTPNLSGYVSGTLNYIQKAQ